MVHWLPLAVSFLVALAIVPAGVRSLAEQGLLRENYRGARVAFPAGIGIVAAALVALVPLALLQKVADVDVLASGLLSAAVYVLGVAFLGLLDDLVGSGTLAARGTQPSAAPPRGWRGHAGAVLEGRFSTGALKAVGALGLALFVLAGRNFDTGEYLLV